MVWAAGLHVAAGLVEAWAGLAELGQAQQPGEISRSDHNELDHLNSHLSRYLVDGLLCHGHREPIGSGSCRQRWLLRRAVCCSRSGHGNIHLQDNLKNSAETLVLSVATKSVPEHRQLYGTWLLGSILAFRVDPISEPEAKLLRELVQV